MNFFYHWKLASKAQAGGSAFLWFLIALGYVAGSTVEYLILAGK